MKKLAVVALTAVLLSGCAASPKPSAANTAACSKFENATNVMFEAFEDSDVYAEAVWARALVGLSDAALSADGRVQKNLRSLIDAWPSVEEARTITATQYALNDRLDMVARACGDSGVAITYASFDLPN